MTLKSTKCSDLLQDERPVAAAPNGVVRADTRPLYYIIKEGRLSVDPKLAARIMEEAPYEGQRKTYTHHVKLLADMMRRGRFTDGSQVAFGYFDNRLHFVNGRHRMMAVIESGRTIEFQVLIVVVASAAELDTLYYRFDVAQRTRSITEVLNAAKAADQHGLSKTMTKATYDAVALVTNGLQRPHYLNDPIKARSIDARLDAARHWWGLAGRYQDLVSGAPKAFKSKLYSQGVVAVALLTLKHQPEPAEEFWGGIAENDGLRKGDARHTLILDLQNRRLNAGASQQAAAATAKAWNAFYEGRQLKIIKVYPDHKVILLGTPLDGRRK